jgi:hypothetical protein
MRSTSILALLLIVMGVQPAWAQPEGYCRIYRCMTIGGSACYYCLPCDSCREPVGYVGGWMESTGGCLACGTGAAHCVGGAAAPTIRPGAAPPRDDAAPPPPGTAPPMPHTAPTVTTVDALTEEPEILWNPDFVTDVQKWKLKIDIPGEGNVDALLVTATVKPKKKNGGPEDEEYEKGFLGFAVRCSANLSYPTVTAVQVSAHGNGHKFKFKGEDGTTHTGKKCTIGPLVTNE